MSAFVGGGVALRRAHDRPVSCRRQRHVVAMASGASASPGPPSPASNPYRMFGITEDADYEEVENAYKRMLAKHKEDPKMTIKVEMTKEAIMEDRLQKRMKGLMTPKVKESPFERKPAKKRRFRVPKFLRGIVRMPDQAYLRRVSTLLGIFLIMPLFLPKLSASFMAISGMSAMGFLYNRGLPEEPKDDMGRPGAVRPVEKDQVLKTIGLICLFGGLGFGLAKIILTYVALPLWYPQESVVSTTVILGFWVSCTFFQVQEGPAPSAKKKGKGWGPKKA